MIRTLQARVFELQTETRVSTFAVLVRSWLVMALAALLFGLGCSTAEAQPAEGSVIENRIDVGGGRWLPIPEGSWKVASKQLRNFNKKGVLISGGRWSSQAETNINVGEWIFLLKNQSDSALIQGVVVRYAIEGFEDPDFCERASGLRFPIDRHGTSDSQLISKCSGVFIPDDASRVPLFGGQFDYAIEIPGPFLGGTASRAANLIVARLGVRQLLGRRADISLLIRTALSDGEMSALEKDIISYKNDNSVRKALKDWSPRAVEHTVNGFLRGSGVGPLPPLEAWLKLALDALPDAASSTPLAIQREIGSGPGSPSAALLPLVAPAAASGGGTAVGQPSSLVPPRVNYSQGAQRPQSAVVLEAGAVIEEKINVAAGIWFPVPEGNWLIVESKTNEIVQPIIAASLPAQANFFTQSGQWVPVFIKAKERLLIIRNRLDSSAIAAMVFRYSLESFDAPGLCSQSTGFNFLFSRYGTADSQMLSKCSGFSLLAGTSTIPLPGGQVQEQLDLGSLVGSSSELNPAGWIVARMGVLGLGQRRVDITALIRTNLSEAQAKALEKSAITGAEHAVASVLKDWAARVVDQTENAFMRGTGSGLLPALDAPLKLAIRSLPLLADASSAQQRQAPSALAPVQPVTTAPPTGIAAPALVTSKPPPPAPATTAVRPPVVTPAAPASSASATTFAAASKVDELAAELARLREEVTRQRAAQAAMTAVPPPPVTQPVPAPKARRLALIIGNDSYVKVSVLQNARADARSVGASLAQLGYAVTLRLDLTERSLKDELRLFKAQIQGGDEVVFFFAGHGLQMGGANYILPTDIRGESEDQVRDDALPLQKVLDEIQERKARFTLAIIDACRDNPFRGSGRSIGSRGLAPTAVATGQMVMFSAGAGQQALDRLGDQDREPNGLFTRILLQEMAKPGLSIDRVMRVVRSRVVELAKTIGHEQVPAVYDQSIGEYFMRQ